MSFTGDESEAMGGLAYFNMQYGFLEGFIRGMRSGFLKEADYTHLSQCDSLEDVKMNLQETDYEGFLGSETAITPAAIEKAALDKLVTEFTYMQSQATGPLAKFLDYVTYEYMIDNVMLLLKGTLSGRPVEELIAQCHPLGLFKESTMRNIPAHDSSRGYADLYETVLVDTPVGPYFSKYLEEYATTSAAAQIRSAGDVRGILEEVQIEILKNALMKLYLEDFYQFVQNIGGDAAEIMGNIIMSRADRYAINITLNSLGTPLNEPAMRETVRRRLYPSIGYLYPYGTDTLAKASDEAKLAEALSKFPYYYQIWTRNCGGGGTGDGSDIDAASLDDEFFKRDVMMAEMAFEGQMHVGCFYGYIKLKEQEIRNLVWISECILQRRKDMINKYIPIFCATSSWRAQGAAGAKNM